MSEKAAVATVMFMGIYDTNNEEFVDTIPAQKDITSYKLIVVPMDQYGRPVEDKYTLGTTLKFSVAQILTNGRVAGLQNTGAPGANTMDTVEINGREMPALNLDTDDGKVVKAGSFRVIVIGDRFGSVMDETIEVAQIPLLRSFTFSQKDTIYGGVENELDYTAIDVNGNEVTDYKTLTKLVPADKFTFGTGDTSTVSWEKRTDGTAKLVYNAATVPGSDANNYKETDVRTVTATCNSEIDIASQLVVPKSFTVYEDQVPYSVVKYTGNTASQSQTPIKLDPTKVIVEDQYGNTLSYAQLVAMDGAGKGLYDYVIKQNGAALVTKNNQTFAQFTNESLPIQNGDIKIYVSADPSGTTTFNKNNAQATITLIQADPRKVTNLTATWYGNDPQGELIKGTIQDVKVDQKDSGISAKNFVVTGTYKGKTITLTPEKDYTVVLDTYVPIKESEKETKVGVATATLNVVLVDENNEEYSEQVEATYMYSAMAGQVSAITAGDKVNGVKGMDLTVSSGAQIKVNEHAGVIKDDTTIPTQASDFNQAPWFLIFDQYGYLQNSYVLAEDPSNPGQYIAVKTGTDNAYEDLTFEVVTGKKTDGIKVINPGLHDATLTGVTTANNGGEFTVTATLPNGLSASQKVILNVTA